jgi:hypothetical protein
LDSNELLDLQFQAEIEQYDAIMENAHVIAEKERQRQRQEKERDLESDGELSVLASSLFNGMDGIELGQSGDVEMGGTSVGLTDQDGQDSQNGQDSQGGGLQDVGSRFGGGKAILGAGTSPRRTRSGKVVKYSED